MLYRKTGSLLVVFLLVNSLLLVLAVASWYSLTQMRIFAHARCQVIKEQALVDGLLRSAVTSILQDANVCLNAQYEDQSWSLVFDPWPTRELVDRIGCYRGIVEISIAKKTWQIRASLMKNSIVKRQGSCSVQILDEPGCDSAHKKSEIIDWTIS
jgi:hypothetical protein